MITVNLMTILVATYVVAHIVCGLVVHRRSLPVYRKFNEDNPGEKKIEDAHILPLFIHRMIFGLPHRLITLFVVCPAIFVVYICSKIMGQMEKNNRLSPRFFIPKTLERTDASEVVEMTGPAWAWNVISAIIVIITITTGMKHGIEYALIVPGVYAVLSLIFYTIVVDSDS